MPGERTLIYRTRRRGTSTCSLASRCPQKRASAIAVGASARVHWPHEARPNFAPRGGPRYRPRGRVGHEPEPRRLPGRRACHGGARGAGRCGARTRARLAARAPAPLHCRRHAPAKASCSIRIASPCIGPGAAGASPITVRDSGSPTSCSTSNAAAATCARSSAALERWIIDALADLGVAGETRQGRVGIWVRRPEKGAGAEDKIAAIGVRLRKWVSLHGISLNVRPDLSHFAGIVPCGIAGHGRHEPRRAGCGRIDGSCG